MRSIYAAIPANKRAQYNAAIALAMPEAGPDTFNVPLSANGLDPATSYGTGWRGLTEAQYAQIVQFAATHTGTFVADADTTTWDQFLLGHALVKIAPNI
jgi:hypothetical protein